MLSVRARWRLSIVVTIEEHRHTLAQGPGHHRECLSLKHEEIQRLQRLGTLENRNIGESRVWESEPLVVGGHGIRGHGKWGHQRSGIQRK